jgi:hypothetical protein
VNELKATNDWDKIETMVEAEVIAKAARNAPSATPGKRTSTTPGKRTSNGKSPPPKTAPQGAAETAPLSIFREGTARSNVIPLPPHIPTYVPYDWATDYAAIFRRPMALAA